MSSVKEFTAYCYKTRLKYINRNEYFEVPFTILAEDYVDAKSRLEEWLKNPEQTGFNFEECLGYVLMPSQSIIVDVDYIESSVANKENDSFISKLLEENSKLKKSNRNWRRKCQRLKTKFYGEQNDC